MTVIKINDIRDQVEELVTRVQAGETILIEKDGEIVAELLAKVKTPAVDTQGTLPRRKIDVTALEEFTRSQPLQKESAGNFIRRMRDEDRY
jgi:antitoxin (DNA-binding transcriptional repressor) of toxin-antitoxin stability system